MALSSELISQFVKNMKDEPKANEDGVTVTGTAAEYAGTIYVQLDGSDQLTPITSSTVGIKDGDRVTVQIKNHKTTVTGNTSSPSAGKDDVDQVKDDVLDQISEFEIIIAGKADIDDLNAEKARIDELIADNVTIKGDLTAANGKIDNLEADNVTINQKLTAAEADIDQIHTDMLTADAADLKYATIENLEATNADVNNLEATYATIDGKLTAAEADIDDLQANKLSADQADIRYAKIDFANIGEAAVENLFAKSGIIEDLVVSGGHVTGELVGVTIKGDLIEGGTVKADKLVVQGSDGLYYKLNVEGESVAAEQTEYNSLNGSVITAKSITAEKVNVDDLVAFNATIGGFNLTSGSLYSGVKSSLDNTTQGIYMDDQGQLAVGDGSNFLKYYKDADGTWKLEISAQSIKMGSSSTTVEETIEEIKVGLDKTIVSTVEEFYKSSSPTELNGGNWSSTQPTWTGGTYIWRRTKVTYGDNHTEYTPSETGVCITGNTGDKGDPGDDGASVIITSTAVDYQASINGTTPPTETWTTSIPSVPAGQYLWTRTTVNYSDGTSTVSYSVSRQGANGADGSDGSDGTSVTITNTAVTYAASTNGTTAPSSGWQNTIPTVAQGSYLWTKTVVTYSDGKSTTAYSVSRQGSDGSDGSDGKGIKSTVITYNVHTSGTTAPTDTWSSTIPTVPEGQYLWTRTVTTYTDDSTTTAYSVGRMGENGADGSPGKNGTSVTVTSTATTYNVHTSGTSVPTDSWSSTIPTVPAGQYLWTRIITTYSDGKTATSYSVARQGQDGSDGSDGRGISSTTVTYQAGSSGTTIPTGNWSSSIPSVSAGQYLWTRTVITYTKGTPASTTSYSVGRMGQNGSPGSDGSDGRGIQSTAVTYQAHSSQTSAPTGTWGSSVPTLTTAKPYLWTRTIITYTDGTSSTGYSVSSTLESFEIGSRNLLLDSDTDYSNGSYPTHIYTMSEKMVAGDIYTIRLWGKLGEGKTNFGAYLDGGIIELGSLIDNGDGTYSRTFIGRAGTKNPSEINIYPVASSVSTISTITRIKLEKGNKATDWTPAPEDVDQSIGNVQDNLEDMNSDISDSLGSISDELHVAQGDITDLTQTVNTTTTRVAELEQFSEGWSFNFTTIQEQITQLGDQVNTSTTETLKYIKFIDGEIWLGKDPDPGEDDFKVVISNERIRFLQNNVEIAYISNNQLYITNAQVTQRLDIGNFAFFPRQNGNLTLRFTGQ